MEYKIAVIPGDGIGVDVIREAVRWIRSARFTDISSIRWSAW